MIGPLDCWTTARSCDKAGAAAGAGAVLSVDSFPEHPASSVLTDAARAARPKSLRLRAARDSLLGTSVAHVPQDVGLQLPQALAALPIRLNNSSIAISPRKGCAPVPAQC
jgi:hypothetical protein